MQIIRVEKKPLSLSKVKRGRWWWWNDFATVHALRVNNAYIPYYSATQNVLFIHKVDVLIYYESAYIMGHQD